MANSLLVLLLLVSATYFVAAQPRVSNKIRQGSSLTPTGTSSWLSSSGLFAFGFYPQANNRYGVGIFLAGLPLNQTIVWTANRDDPPVSDDVTLSLTTDGELVLLQQSQDSARDVVTLNNRSISFASMLDSGNFVLYDSNQEMIWQSFDHPTDTILPGQKLEKEEELFSSKSEFDHSTGIFRLKMQSDSNLVQYPVETGTTDTFAYAYWASNTFNGINGINVTLNLDSVGHLYLLNNSVQILKNLSDGRSEKQRVYLMKIHYDGILRLYSLSLDGKGNSSTVVWESSDDGCDPKGLCGLNGYCSLYDNKPKCECPPGFDYVSPGNWTAGCERINIADSCNNNERRIQYSMSLLNNTYWENNAYRTHNVKFKEECEAACLQDCECVVAFFQAGECRKQRFPLRYGRNVSFDSNIAYIKVAPPPLPGKKTTIIPVLTAGIGSGLVVMVVVLLLSYWGVRQHRQKERIKLKENFFKQNGGIMLQQLLYKTDITAERAKIYTEEELKKATDNYNESNVIGQGGYGTVYKGVLDNTLVAIKRSKVVDRSQIDQFVNEMIILTQINHPNVVKLLGCCMESPVPLLVYEFVTNDTLFHHIHDVGCASSIPWDMRLRIATETAGALAHMHSAPVHIIHRDVKSANILLDNDYTAKVSDFGVSRLFSLEETHLATLVQGTFGYIDPEYFHSGILTQKSDVYSFGVVLVELLTGANVVSFDREEQDRNLGMYFLFAMEDDRLHEILEPRVRKEGHADQLKGVAELAKKCLRIKGDKRPTMKEVVEELVQLRELKIENHPWV
ncbi:Receptor-like serine/threonine-protein kinase [Heracleum sosnowskyi]|uniref:Receptor-like serine/threonine-protein kinase n=1 Tax=Heracleum sosnowskyi TaxID=360622 RepID=A0AAD8HRI3_9APIA|nr:Receptor-like serine/threonine-protein kinase [Heracleum sosnowskyi]